MMKNLLIASALALVALAACAPAATPAPTAAPKPTDIPKPTQAPPTATAVPPTVAPTATKVPPTPTPVPPTATAVPKVAKPLNLSASTVFVRDALVNVTQGIQGITINGIVPLGADPHEYEPTPKDVKAVSDSQAVFINGAGFEEEWLGKLIKNAGGSRPIVDLSEGVKLNKIDAQFQSEFDNDPHYWQDPERWQQAVNNAAKGVVALVSASDPSIAEAVKKNAEAYIAKIKETDAMIKTEVAKIPADKRVLVTTHDAFGYYAQRYGFKVVGTVIPGPSTASGAATPRNIKALVDTIKPLGVKAIFIEEGVNPKLTEAVAKEAGIGVIEKLYLDTLSDDKGPAATYLDMLKHNTLTIAGALK